MVDSVTLTRQGYVKHLAVLQSLLKLVGELHGNVSRSFAAATCELERNDKIVKAFVKLQELIWETGAVSEKIHREKGRDDPSFDAHDRDYMNGKTEEMRRRFHAAAKSLEHLARRLWDADAPADATPDAVYPGAVEEPDSTENPNQLKFDFRPPPVVDFKKRAANDDTTQEENDDE